MSHCKRRFCGSPTAEFYDSHDPDAAGNRLFGKIADGPANVSDQHATGMKILAELFPDAVTRLAEVLPGDSAVEDFVVDFVYGVIYARPQLSLRDRQMLTIALLVALGDLDIELAGHIRAGLKAGLTRTEVSETILHCAIGVGFPRAVRAIRLMNQTLAEQ